MISDTIWDWVAGQIATYDLIVCAPHKHKRVLIRQCDAIQTFLDNHRWFDVCEFCISGVKLFSNNLANSWFLLLGTKIVGRLWTCTIVIISLTVLKCQMSRTCKKTTWQLKWQEIDWRKTLLTCYLVDKLLVGRLKKVRATKHVIHQCDFLGWLWSGFDGTSSDEEKCDMTCDVFWRTTWSIDRRFWNTQSGAKIWKCVNVGF